MSCSASGIAWQRRRGFSPCWTRGARRLRSFCWPHPSGCGRANCSRKGCRVRGRTCSVSHGNCHVCTAVAFAREVSRVVKQNCSKTANMQQHVRTYVLVPGARYSSTTAVPGTCFMIALHNSSPGSCVPGGWTRTLSVIVDRARGSCHCSIRP